MKDESNSKNYYDLVGVARHADQKQIEEAFLHLADKCRPDLHPNDAAAARQFALLEEAYETLGNPEMRAIYDESLPSLDKKPAPVENISNFSESSSAPVTYKKFILIFGFAIYAVMLGLSFLKVINEGIPLVFGYIVFIALFWMLFHSIKNPILRGFLSYLVGGTAAMFIDAVPLLRDTPAKMPVAASPSQKSEPKITAASASAKVNTTVIEPERVAKPVSVSEDVVDCVDFYAYLDKTTNHSYFEKIELVEAARKNGRCKNKNN